MFTIEGPDLPQGETLSIMGDPYTNAMERFLAEHYGRVTVADPLHLEVPLGEVVCEYGPDDILF